MPNRITIDQSDRRELVETRRRGREKEVRQLLERVGQRVVELLAGFMAERTRDGRRKHPGGWADRTGRMAESYEYEVERTSNGWSLTILNTAWYAAIVEAKEGLFVVRGVAEKGGPVHRAFREALRELAPHLEYREA